MTRAAWAELSGNCCPVLWAAAVPAMLGWERRTEMAFSSSGFQETEPTTAPNYSKAATT